MVIEVGDELDYENEGIIIDKTINFYYYENYIKPEFKIKLLKKEIFNNIPNIITYFKDLYIYIRSDDIFNSNPHPDYSQPPLCFYQSILNYFKFKRIFIIAKNNKNPIIDKLLTLYPNIIYIKNSLKTDISYIANAYNLVSAPSTFFFSIFQFNDNAKFLWEFDFQRNNESRNNYLEHLIKSFHIPKIKYTIYRMISSIKYKKEMHDWKCSKEQIELMLTTDCPFNFSIIIPK